MLTSKITFVLAAIAAINTGVNGFLPVVLWHGMGDSCCNPFSMGRIKSMIEENHNDTYVYSVMIGDNVIQDTESGFFKNVNDQVEEVCNEINADPMLAGGFHAIGFSQGSQFLRALAQRCPSPTMGNFVSLAGQHQGVFGFPGCDPNNGNVICEDVRVFLSKYAYNETIQDHLVQAEYWHDSLNEQAYREGSIFLADINQENVVNETYRTNMLQVDNFVLVKFLNDTTVIPNESAWFGFYTPGQDVEIQTLQDSILYTEDRLGLRQMETEGRLHFLSTYGGHLQFSDQWFLDNILPWLT